MSVTIFGSCDDLESKVAIINVVNADLKQIIWITQYFLFAGLKFADDVSKFSRHPSDMWSLLCSREDSIPHGGQVFIDEQAFISLLSFEVEPRLVEGIPLPPSQESDDGLSGPPIRSRFSQSMARREIS